METLNLKKNDIKKKVLLSKKQLKILNNNKEFFKELEKFFISKKKTLTKKEVIELIHKYKINEKLNEEIFKISNFKKYSNINIIEQKRISKKEQRIIDASKRKHKYKLSDTYTLRIKNVKKSYGLKKVLKGVTFDILKGEKVALIGKNGSGKSTLISILSQQLKMSRGEIVYGYATNKIDSFELMGIQFQALSYPEGFVVKDVISFFNVSVEKSKRLSKSELENLVIKFGINKFINQQIDRLSGGQQQRINILLAMIKKPKLLILDEISTGLDVESAEVIKGYIYDYLEENKDASLLLVSHSDEEIREMVDKVFVLEQGKIVEEMVSSKLTQKKFLEITSRELKYTKKEAAKQKRESQRLLNGFERAYTKREPGEKTRLEKYLEKIKNKITNYSIVNSESGKKKTEHKIFTFFNSIIIFKVNKLNSNKNKKNILKKEKPSKLSKKIEIVKENVKTYSKKVLGDIENENFKEGNIIEINDISKTYGKKVGAVRNVSLSIKDGERVSITGSNGSGKTTLVEMMAFVKTADGKSKRFKNMKHLVTADYHNVLKELDYKKDIELKQFKAMYIFSQELYAKEIEEIKNGSEEFIKNSNLTEEKARLKIQKDIDKIKNQMAKELAIKKAEYQKLEAKLNEQRNIEAKKALNKYHKDKADVLLEESKSKKTNGDFVVPSYILNGKKIGEVVKNNNDPQISYAFAKKTREVKDNVGVQFQYVSFPFDMTVQDVILFFSRSNKYFLSKKEMFDALKIFKLEGLLKMKANRLSGGEKQRLNVLLAIMKSPKILILDEISTGLDVDSIVKIDKFIKDYLEKTKATLILISHNYHEVHSLTDKIIVMNRGKLTEIVDTKG